MISSYNSAILSKTFIQTYLVDSPYNKDWIHVENQLINHKKTNFLNLNLFFIDKQSHPSMSDGLLKRPPYVSSDEHMFSNQQSAYYKSML